ncbi:MAG: carboxy-S-adenosyl-L-methionine synthase CmoA [Deltaproteobacteria bacterium]|nr:carboxy-S-adenosyl-L-methionine synthase CmoA [Deltaproteobacteria bacterium]
MDKQITRDALYADQLERINDFTFDETVADVFDDMLQRSVPGYKTTIAMIGLLAERYAQPNSNIYDLGCSLGTATAAMREKLNRTDCRIIAVDNSSAMIQRCRRRLDAQATATPVDLRCEDILTTDIRNASVVVLNFTLQFIQTGQRLELLSAIRKGLRPGGILVMSEKIAFENPRIDELNSSMHDNYKRSHGYSDLEISQKRTALENVLIPETIYRHQDRLKAAGFDTSAVWFQCFNFASLVALT